nr:PREDICTED: alpha-N-acetylgalactosaminide alpha-2,6-sialyltransferase 2-like [Paralichthys olivaceus]
MIYYQHRPAGLTARCCSVSHSSSRDSEEPLDRKSNSDRWSRPSPTSIFHPELLSTTALQEKTPAHTPAPTSETQTAAEQQQQPAESTSRSEAVGETRSSTRGPTLKPPQFTEPPFIGDTYMGEDVPPQNNCTDGVRSRVAQTEFGGRFLRRIPVLQWADHLSREQYQRLSQYPGAHGWGGIDYNCETNGAIIKGFEQDVGSRTTHYTFSTNTLMNSMRSYAGLGYKGPPLSQETRYVFLPDHDRDYLLMKAAATHVPVERGPERAKDPTKFFGEDVTAEKLKMYHPDFIRYLRNRFLRSSALKTKYKDIYRPSTGAVMLLAALHSCDQVSAYGFMTPDYKNYSDHYYDSNYHPVGFYINHDLRMEMTLWQQLHQAGLMRLYMH